MRVLGVLGLHCVGEVGEGRWYRPTVVPFSAGGAHTVSAFAITNELAGGVVQSVNRPVVAGEVPA
ncbi:MAG: hypothetical protein ACYDDZ_01600 [Acidimicrobiales bacterium]